MPYYRVAGEVPRKRHTRFRDPAGNLYAEELMGEEGFVSDSSLLYHAHPPTAIVKSEGLADPSAEVALRPNHPLLPRHYLTQDLPAGGDLVLGRQLLMANDDVQISFAAADSGSDLYRNSTGDEAVYLRSGSATFESVYGSHRGRAGRLCRRPARHHPPLDARRRWRARARRRGARPHPAAEALPVAVRAVP